jgi:inhibitor of cysteine peptidase
MRRSWLVLVALSLMIVACSGDDDAGAGGASNASGGPRQIPITASDGGTIIGASVGDELIVDLAGNPSTGYSWVNESEATGVLVAKGEPEFISDSELIGASGTMRCRFDAVEPGTARLELAYRRPWEENVEPEARFSVTVLVE